MKFKRCILHIGTEKTGSTSIQALLDRNRALFLENGAFVPSCLGTPNHIGITVACASPRNVMDLRRHLPRSSADAADLRAHTAEALANEARSAAASGAEVLLISNEHLHSRIRSRDEARSVIELLSPHVERIDCLLYLRRQDRLAASLHSTRLKLDRGTRRDIFSMASVGKQYYDYHHLANLWRSAITHGDLHIRRFEREHLFQGDLLTDYLRFCELPIDFPFVQEQTSPLNESLSPAAQQFLEIFNGRIPRFIDGKPNPERGNIVSILEKHFPGTVPTITRGEAVEFYGMFEESNRSLADEYFPGLPLFDSDFSMYPESDPMGSLSFEDAADIACRLWITQRAAILRLEQARTVTKAD